MEECQLIYGVALQQLHVVVPVVMDRLVVELLERSKGVYRNMRQNKMPTYCLMASKETLSATSTSVSNQAAALTEKFQSYCLMEEKGGYPSQ